LNYFFCFRWVLIQFKREFKFDEVQQLWEVLWTDHMGPHFHLYVCVAILKRHRDRIIEQAMTFDELLCYINSLAGNLPLDATLRDAETVFHFASTHGLTVDSMRDYERK